MSDPINKVLGAAGPPLVVTIEGQTWKLSHCTKHHQARYETWLETKIRQEVISQKSKLPPGDYAESLSLVLENIAMGKYGWGELAWERSLKSSAGLARFFQVLLEDNHPEVLGWTQEQLEELMSKDQEAFSSLIAQAMGGPDPNAAKPTKVGTPV